MVWLQDQFTRHCPSRKEFWRPDSTSVEGYTCTFMCPQRKPYVHMSLAINRASPKFGVCAGGNTKMVWEIYSLCTKKYAVWAIPWTQNESPVHYSKFLIWAIHELQSLIVCHTKADRGEIGFKCGQISSDPKLSMCQDTFCRGKGTFWPFDQLLLLKKEKGQEQLCDNFPCSMADLTPP